MRIAIDKKTISAYKKNSNEYIYLFDNEPYKDLLSLNMHCVYYKNCDFVDINLTDYNVSCYKQTTIDKKDYDKPPEKKNYKLAIIIPVYNSESTLEKCLTSILEQTYTNYEIILVNDCSTDNSLKIAKNMLKSPHKIVELKYRRYNGGARNVAIEYLSDDIDYIWYIDSDDWLLDNKVLEKIIMHLQTYPDVLFVGMSHFKDGKLSPSYIPKYRDKYEAIAGWSGSCGAVVKKSLAIRQECFYNEGTLKEDKNHHCRICFYMKDFKLLQEPLYVWNRDNNQSVTHIRDEILWGTSTIRHYADTKQLYLELKGKDDKIDRFMESRLRMTKQEMESGNDRQW